MNHPVLSTAVDPAAQGFLLLLLGIASLWLLGRFFPLIMITCAGFLFLAGSFPNDPVVRQLGPLVGPFLVLAIAGLGFRIMGKGFGTRRDRCRCRRDH